MEGLFLARLSTFRRSNQNIEHGRAAHCGSPHAPLTRNSVRGAAQAYPWMMTMLRSQS